MSQKEVADTRYTRPLRQTARDRHEYRGVAKVPLARAWMLDRFEAAKAKGDQREMDRLAAEMRRLGMLKEDEK